MSFGKLAIEESVAAMRALGARTVEAYPVEGKLSATFLWSGTPRQFEDAGFTRVSPLGKNTFVYSLVISSP